VFLQRSLCEVEFEAGDNDHRVIRQRVGKIPRRRSLPFEHYERNQNDEHVTDNNYLPLPRINANTMALALRWTGEVNRRLREGTACPFDESAALVEATPSPPPPAVVRGGGGTEAPVESTSLSSPTSHSQTITVFHAKTPIGKGHGAARWGPPLEDFVADLGRALGLQENAEQFALALVYLDRASSPEIPRQHGKAVPYVQPQTAHRLVTAALLWATHITMRTPLPVLMEHVVTMMQQQHPEQTLDLVHMLEWMQAALGELGFYVTPIALQSWRAVLTAAEEFPALSGEYTVEQSLATGEDEKDGTDASGRARTTTTRDEKMADGSVSPTSETIFAEESTDDTETTDERWSTA
jgi:hypothetical protein